MPVISRDGIKEGYVNTFGVKHDQLSPDTDGIVSDFFFDIVSLYLTNKVSVIIEAAFQHAVWEARMPMILELSIPLFIVCSIDEEIAAQRHLRRGLADPRREFYHEDKRVSLYRATGEIGTPGRYVAPNFNVPTIQVSTDGTSGPYIMVSVELLEKVRKLLVENDVPHWVDHHAVSVDGRPAVTVINLYRKVDPRPVQELLDAAA